MLSISSCNSVAYGISASGGKKASLPTVNAQRTRGGKLANLTINRTVSQNTGLESLKDHEGPCQTHFPS